MSDVVAVAATLIVIFSMAAGILFVLDHLTIRRRSTQEERKALMQKRTSRWSRRWGYFILTMAAVSLVVRTFNLGHETTWERVGWGAPSALVVIGYLLSDSKEVEDDQHD
jgi:ABC-type Fe3+ transport system permease subunit